MSRLGLTARGCRWPSWKDGPPSHRYCGKPIKHGSPYCPHHHAICYQTLRSSTSEADHHRRAEAEYTREKL
jgi:hypothetical protein